MLKFLSGRSFLSLLLLLVLTSMPSCGKTPLSFLTGSGPNVAANTQVGKTNNQTLGQSKSVESTINIKPDSKVETVRQTNTETKVATEKVETIVVNEIPTWLILLFAVVCGFLIPSPKEILRGIKNAFKS